MAASNFEIDSMYKYRVERFWKELSLITQQKPDLTVPDLLNLDQYHYLGVEAVDLAAEKLELSPLVNFQESIFSSNQNINSKQTIKPNILDIGSGIGGTARYLAWKYNCEVTGIELQPQLHEVGVAMTEATGMQDQVRLMVGDFCNIAELEIADHAYDAWISLMVFLHICDRAQLFQNCARVLKPQGQFYIEDYFAAKTLTASEQEALAKVIACPFLPSRAQYIQDLATAGFINIEFIDITHLWQPWLQQRLEKFIQNRSYYEGLFDRDLIDSYQYFYQTVADLFSGGNIGGARIYGNLGI